ncbi:methionine gamma-lyase family protein [Ruminococcaceae bacterium OttesenSCG-928-D13]|nr:methionine gamma-lyase family protein [Ruminococcaceae bacterium OttesenSCG-928-D13]
MIEQFVDVSPELLALDAEVMAGLAPQLLEIDRTKEYNQLAMLRAFTECGVAANHLQNSTGYGYDSAARDKLEQVFAALTGSEAALFGHGFASGTHTLAVALFGVLRPGDELLCATGRPYDTLHGVIGLSESQNAAGPPAALGGGSLADFGIRYRQLELTAEGAPDLAAITAAAPGARMLYLQRSRGYAARPTLSLGDIEAAAQAARAANPGILVMVDNCYGEFVHTEEPTHRGADLMAGSLIKNPGGGIAPCGGYIAGRADLVDLCAQRLTAPGVGGEVGCVPGDILRQLWLGLYFAPAVTAEAMKTGAYATALFGRLGYAVSPGPGEVRQDIITAITLGGPEKLVALCRAIQKNSPVDSHLTPEPWPMPGYDCDVIMAAGAFTQGSSIELSCDAPMRPPYTAYLQGSLNFAGGRAAILSAAGAVFGGS